MGILDFSDRSGDFLSHASEERREMDIGGVFSPGEKVAFGSLELVPSLVSSQSLGVEFLEESGGDGGSNDLLDFITRRPDVLEHDGLTLLVVTDRVFLEVNVDVTGNGVGNDKRRTGEIVTSGERVNTSLEVSVSGEDSTSYNVFILDGLLDNIGESSRVSNAGHASVTGSGETELVHVGVNSSDFEVAGDDSRSRGERSLDVRTSSKSLSDSVLAEESSLEHNTGVGSVGARGDGGDGNGTMGEVVLFSFEFKLGGMVTVSFGNSESLEASGGCHAFVEVLLHVSKSDSIVRALGSGQARLNGGHIEFHNVGRVGRVDRVSVVLSEEALGTEVSLDHLNFLSRLADHGEVVEGLLISREETHSCSVFRRHVSDSSSVGETEVNTSRSEEFNELSDNTSLSEDVGNSEHEISSSGVLGEITSQFKSNDLGEDHRDLLAEHDGFSFDTANTPSYNTKSINHSGVRISSDTGVGHEHAVDIADEVGEPLQIDLMDNTVTGRDNS